MPLERVRFLAVAREPDMFSANRSCAELRILVDAPGFRLPSSQREPWFLYPALLLLLRPRPTSFVDEPYQSCQIFVSMVILSIEL